MCIRDRLYGDVNQFPTASREPHSGRVAQQVLCQVIGLLVPVSFMCLWSTLPRPAYQPSVLAGGLSGRTPWKPHLEACFPLRCFQRLSLPNVANPVSYTHLRAHETVLDLVCRLLLEKKKKKK